MVLDCVMCNDEMVSCLSHTLGHGWLVGYFRAREAPKPTVCHVCEICIDDSLYPFGLNAVVEIRELKFDAVVVFVLMDRVRQVLLLAVREETRDHDRLWSAWCAWARSPTRAELLMMKFAAARGGVVSTLQLAELYEENPWLMGVIGRLRDFCDKSERLVYFPRGQQTRARVCLKGVPLGTELASAMADTELEEPYLARWMSRKVLNMQMRRESRTYPRGFTSRTSSSRRTRATNWLQSFLEVFSEAATPNAADVLRATRQWPRTDKSRGDTTSARGDTIIGSGESVESSFPRVASQSHSQVGFIVARCPSEFVEVTGQRDPVLSMDSFLSACCRDLMLRSSRWEYESFFCRAEGAGLSGPPLYNFGAACCVYSTFEHGHVFSLWGVGRSDFPHDAVAGAPEMAPQRQEMKMPGTLPSKGFVAVEFVEQRNCSNFPEDTACSGHIPRFCSAPAFRLFFCFRGCGLV